MERSFTGSAGEERVRARRYFELTGRHHAEGDHGDGERYEEQTPEQTSEREGSSCRTVGGTGHKKSRFLKMNELTLMKPVDQPSAVTAAKSK